MPRKHNRSANRFRKIDDQAAEIIDKKWKFNPLSPRINELFDRDPTARDAFYALDSEVKKRANQV